MSPPDIPEPDRVTGAPHPRETRALIGQASAEATFLAAYTHERLHHGWLLCGPQGVGKATLAWKIARFLLSQTDGAARATSLDTPPDTPLAQRLLALSEPRLFLLRRPFDLKRGRLKQDITIDETRRLKGFFALSAADGGRRVVIVDAADDMNRNAANALLKLLEEPPDGAVLLLVSHQPSRLLPTIRSRCRTLRCHPLAPADMARALANAGCVPPAETDALAALAAGSVGEALRLTNLGGIQTYHDILALAQTLPALERPRALALAETVTGKGAGPRFELLLHLFDLFLARLARAGTAGPPLIAAGQDEAALLARLSPDATAGRLWAQAQQNLGARARHGRAVNLDPAALILDMVLRIEQTAAHCVAR